VWPFTSQAEQSFIRLQCLISKFLKMNSTIIVGILLIVLIIAPIWWLIRSQGAGKRKLQKEIASLGKDHDINITEHELWSNKVIGIDRENDKAAYAILMTPSNQLFITDLRLFSRCYVEKNLLASDSKNQDIISSINIHFVSREKEVQDTIWPIYIDSVDLTLGKELHIAGEWVDKFNAAIYKNKR
jgi:hypothetical protein